MRVENLGNNVNEYCERTSNGSSTWDICRECAADLEDSPHIFDKELSPYNNDEPEGDEGRGGDVDHPPYEECDYKCVICKKVLDEDEN